MSLANAVGQVIFSQKAGLYMPAIMCDKGDLYQEYSGTSSAPTNIAPDFTTLLPVLSFVVTSSRVSEGLVVPNSMKWYFNGTELTFNSSKLSTNSFSGETGHFEFISYQAGVQARQYPQGPSIPPAPGGQQDQKGGAGEQGVKYGPCENILIENNAVFHAHGGFVIGSEYSGGMKNIVVRNNRFSGTDTGLRFKSGIGRGEKTEGIYISDIYMTDIKDEAVVFECTYMDKKYSVKDDSGDGTAVVPKDAPFVPEFRDIHISNVVCRNVKTAVAVTGLPGLECVHDVTIENSTFYYTKKDKEIKDNPEITITNTEFVEI